MDNKIQINTPVGLASYPHLTRPDEFMGAESYKCNLRLDESNEEAIKFIQTVKKFAEKCRVAALEEANVKLAELKGSSPKVKKQRESTEKLIETLSDQESYRLPFEEEWSDEDDAPTGNILVRTKSKASFKNRKTGEEISLAPKFYAANAQPMTSRPDVRGGSRIALGLTFVPYAAGGDIGAGISARINSVQIISLAGGSAGGDSGFKAHDGYKEDTFTSDVDSADMDY